MRRAAIGPRTSSWRSAYCTNSESMAPMLALARVAARSPRRYPARSMPAPSHVVFVVPFLLESSLRFAGAAGRLPGLKLAILSQEPADRLPVALRPLVASFHQVGDALDAAQ